jgi:hypothetical protein
LIVGPNRVSEPLSAHSATQDHGERTLSLDLLQ